MGALLNGLAGLSLLFSSVACTQGPAPAAPLLESKKATSAFPDDAALLAMIKARVDSGRVAGIVLGVMDADGTTRVVSYGDAGPGAQPLGSDSVFQIGSVTKVFTSTVLAEMAAKGEVRLDAPAQTYAPDGLVMPQRSGKQITLAHLAEQMSGLPRDPPDRPIVDGTQSYAAYSKAMLYDFLKLYELPRDPGEKFEYSNLGSGLLGHLLAARAGVGDYDTLVHQRVLDPLDMTMSGVELTPAMRKALAAGHGPDGLPVEKQLEENWKMPRLEGAGDLHASMNDMLKFLAANIGPPDTPLERAMQAAQKARVPRPQGGMLGLEWNRYRYGETSPELVFHSGAMPGYGAYIVFDPVRRIGVVQLQNTAFLSTDLAYHLLDPSAPLAPLPEPRTEIALPAETMGLYTGVYKWDASPNADPFKVTVNDGRVTVQEGNRARQAVFPESARTFFYRSSDARITFVADASGRATGLVFHQVDKKDYTATRIE